MDAIRYWPCLRIGTSTAPSATGVGASSRLRGQIFQRQDLVAEQPLRLLDAALQVAHGCHLAQVDADRDERLGNFGRQAGDDHGGAERSEEHTSELQSQSNLVCRLLLEKKKKKS